MLLKIPGLATIYESWFRADTYYRTDTRAIYIKKIPEIVKAVAEEITAAKGGKLTTCFELGRWKFADLETRLGPQAAPHLIRYKRAFLVFSATLCAMLMLWLSTLFVKPA